MSSGGVKKVEGRNFRITSDGGNFQIGVKGDEAKNWVATTKGRVAIQHVEDSLTAAIETGTFITSEMLERAVQYLETVLDAPNAAAVIAANNIMTQVEALLRSNPRMDAQSVYQYVKRNGKIAVHDDILRSVVSAIYNAGKTRKSKISIPITLNSPQCAQPSGVSLTQRVLDVQQILDARDEMKRPEPEPVGEPMLPDEDDVDDNNV